MKISYAVYELQADHSLNVTSSNLKRKGALLKVVFDSGNVGHADCHPWIERGDLILEQQMKKLAQGETTHLTYCALEFALLDADHRSKSKNIFANHKIPFSHFLIVDVLNWGPQDVQKLIQQGYTHIKLKMGRDLNLEIESLYALFFDTSLKLRLDFNESLTFTTFCDFLKHIQPLKNSIDFIEDPFPFDSIEWSFIQKNGWRLACDQQVQKAYHQSESAQILIIKPAIQSYKEWTKETTQTRIVTSYLGHPLEQLTAAYVASQIDPLSSEVHGLLSHHAYQPNLFSQSLNWKGPSFIYPKGVGFGFNQELNQLDWITLT